MPFIDVSLEIQSYDDGIMVVTRIADSTHARPPLGTVEDSADTNTTIRTTHTHFFVRVLSPSANSLIITDDPSTHIYHTIGWLSTPNRKETTNGPDGADYRTADDDGRAADGDDDGDRAV
jgi:hypothetical protein